MVDEKAILKLQANLDAEHQKNTDAIKLVLKLLRKTGVELDAPKPAKLDEGILIESPPASNGHQNNNGSESLIYAEIQKKTGQFTLSDLVAALPDVNRSTISGILFREKDKTIRVVVKGQGRRLGIYEKMQ